MKFLKIIKFFVNATRRFNKRVFDFITWDEWGARTWSQEGEDIVLRRIFDQKKTAGFYVDIGAHHPKRFSNTFMFYRKGWSGINIDAMPSSMRLFRKWRSRDINLEIGISKRKEVLDYYSFNEPALNGFSFDLSMKRDQAGGAYHLKEVIKVQVYPLKEVFKQYLDDRIINFMTLDVEGLELSVLESNDWALYRPQVVLIEILKSSLHDLLESPVVQFMAAQGYEVYAKQVNTVIFKDAATRC